MAEVESAKGIEESGGARSEGREEKGFQKVVQGSFSSFRWQREVK